MTAHLTVPEILAWLRGMTPTGQLSSQLSSDSRTVARGDVFFAYPGDAGDGRSYIRLALEAGAKGVVYETENFAWDESWAVPHLAVQGLKQLAGSVANAYYGHPDAKMASIAVTGTNGKTSCTQWLGNALSRLGQSCAVVGTLGIGLYRQGAHQGFKSTGYTTPDAVLLQRRLAELRDASAAALAIEASSIGLHQGRLNGLHIAIALFTNFTRDHLDYHGDMASYESAKTMLFDWPGLQHAIVNLDDAMGVRLIQHVRTTRPGLPIIGYTVAGNTMSGIPVIAATNIRSSHGGTVFDLDSPYGAAHAKTQLVGLFNVSNVLGIVGVLMAKGVPLKDALDAVEALAPVPGRMEQLGGHDAPLAVIDYAHTPDALEKTLGTLREVAAQRGGELWCVFGCGGDRDPGKRPQMGAAAEAADHAILTSDNPRGEEPSAINTQVLAGMKTAPLVIEDRAAAILWAVRHAAKNDVVLLAGKGHETYQEIKGKKLPFLDADHAALALAARATMKGT